MQLGRDTGQFGQSGKGLPLAWILSTGVDGAVEDFVEVEKPVVGKQPQKAKGEFSLAKKTWLREVVFFRGWTGLWCSA